MKVIFLIIALFLVLSLLYLKHCMHHAIDHGELHLSIDKEVSKFMRGGQIPGLVVGVVRPEDEFIKGYGVIKKTQEEKASTLTPSRHSIFQIASVSKVFTATLLQLLDDEGVVNADSHLGDVFKDKSLSPTVQTITLQQLAMHTSGLPRIPKELEASVLEMTGEKDFIVNPYYYVNLDAIFSYLEHANDLHKKDTFHYSNLGMGLLGHALETLTGKNLEELLQEKILRPLNMMQTGITLSGSMQEHLVQGYNAKLEPVIPWHFTALASAGAMYSSVDDLQKFINALAQPDGVYARALHNMLDRSKDKKRYLGWMSPGFIERLLGNKDIIWHNGMVNGYASYVSFNLQSRSSVIVLANSGVDITMLGMMLSRQVRTQSFVIE